MLYLELALWQRQFPKTKAQQSPFNIQTTSGLWETTVSIDCIMTWPEGEEQQNRFIIRRDSRTSRKSCTVCPLKRFIMKVSSPKRQEKSLLPHGRWAQGCCPGQVSGACPSCSMHASFWQQEGSSPKANREFSPNNFCAETQPSICAHLIAPCQQALPAVMLAASLKIPCGDQSH